MIPRRGEGGRCADCGHRPSRHVLDDGRCALCPPEVCAGWEREAERHHEGARFAADGRPQALAAQCSTCVFRPGNQMRLQSGRLRDLVETNRATGAALTCHQTLSYGAHPEVGQSACRGFLDAYPDVTVAQLADRLFGGWHLIPPPDEPAGDEGEQ